MNSVLKILILSVVILLGTAAFAKALRTDGGYKPQKTERARVNQDVEQEERLQKGDKVLSINGKKMKKPSDAVRYLKTLQGLNLEEVEIVFLRNGEQKTMTLNLPVSE